MKKEQKQTKPIYIDGRSAILVLVTVVLLVACLVTMTVGLILDAVDSKPPEFVPSGGNVSGESGKPSSGQNKPSTVKIGEKTGISLPSPTNQGTYLHASSDSTKDIGVEEIKSAAAVLIDITDGNAVAQKSADERVYPASMTKVMTLLIACENATDPNKLLTVTADMVEKYANKGNGASVAFEWKEGYQVTVEDALHLVIYDSDTYACWLLADHVTDGKGEQAFVDMMNSKAASMGLTATNFTNCTGLYNENHYTTCREMAAIMAAVMNNPTAKQVITKNDEYKIDIYENGEKKNTQSTWSDWYTGRLEEYRWGAAGAPYAGNGSDIKIIAGKTGYEDIPKCCFVTAAIDTETDRQYVCVQVGRTSASQPTVNAKASTDDTRIIYQKYAVE